MTATLEDYRQAVRTAYAPVDYGARRQAIVAMYRSGASLKQCGEAFGVSGPRIREILIDEGVQRRMGRGESRADPALDAEIVRLYRSGLTEVEAGKRVGRSHVAVSRALERQGEPRRKRGPGFTHSVEGWG